MPLPIFIDKKTNEPLRDPEVIENIAKIYEKEGSDCWFHDDPQRFLGKKYNKDNYIKSNKSQIDVLKKIKEPIFVNIELKGSNTAETTSKIIKYFR